MGIVSSAADTYYTYKFIRILTSDWKDMEAYDNGIVDENGKNLRKSKDLSSSEKDSYTLFHRLVFSIKRLMEKVPGGKSIVGKYAAALFLIKETTGMTDNQIRYAFSELGIDLTDTDLNLTEESQNDRWFVLENGNISPGVYYLSNEIASPSTGNIVGEVNSKVIVHKNSGPIGYALGSPIHEAQDRMTGLQIYVTPSDLVREEAPVNSTGGGAVNMNPTGKKKVIDRDNEDPRYSQRSMFKKAMGTDSVRNKNG